MAEEFTQRVRSVLLGSSALNNPPNTNVCTFTTRVILWDHEIPKIPWMKHWELRRVSTSKSSLRSTGQSSLWSCWQGVGLVNN